MRNFLVAIGLALALVACTFPATPALQEESSPPDLTSAETPQSLDVAAPEPTAPPSDEEEA